MRTLINYPWPGNVRELENTVRFIANITDRETITPDYLPQVFFQHGTQSLPVNTTHFQQNGTVSLKTAKHASEKEIIIETLDKCGRSVNGKKEAAKLLSISLTTLYVRMSAYNIK